MIGRMIVSIAGAALALSAARPVHALACEPGEVGTQYSAWRGRKLSSPHVVALPGRVLIWWDGDLRRSVLVEDGVVTGRPWLGSLIAPNEATVAATADVVLVVGIDGRDLVAQRVSPTGELLGDRIYLDRDRHHTSVSAVSDGTSFLVAWADSTVDPANPSRDQSRVRAATIAPDGVVGEVRDLASPAWPASVRAVRAGDITWVLWSDASGWSHHGTFAARLDREGAPLDPAPLALVDASSLVAAVSTGDHAMLAVDGEDGRYLIPIDRDGAVGAAVDFDHLGDDRVAALTPSAAGDGYLLWTTPSVFLSGQFPATPEELRAHSVHRDGTLVDSAPFAVVRGIDPSVAYDGTAIRYAIGEDSANAGTSVIRTGSITASGGVDPGIVVDRSRMTYETWEVCSPRPPPPSRDSDEPDDSYPYYGCSAGRDASGATTAGLVLLAVLAAVAPRRRRRCPRQCPRQ
jgi:MYXO-CTERM domain-containing protein